jgi:nucleotide-binding universal stress UspA family protein
MLDKVLLAVDGSDYSRKAIPLAIDLAKKSNGNVVVLHVREHTVDRGGTWELEEETEADRIVTEVCRQIEEAGVAVRKEVRRSLLGHVARAIVDAAEDEGRDLIVMGSRGLSDLRGLLLGSVTHKVLQLSSRPVLVAR